jgi:hypothetical protein
MVGVKPIRNGLTPRSANAIRNSQFAICNCNQWGLETHIITNYQFGEKAIAMTFPSPVTTDGIHTSGVLGAKCGLIPPKSPLRSYALPTSFFTILKPLVYKHLKG